MATVGMGVDPTQIPKSMSREQLEWWILFGICVAGKGAKQTEAKINALLQDIGSNFKHKFSPFELIEWVRPCLMSYLKKHRLGQYKRIWKAFREVIKLDLASISVEQLEAVHGIGPKTARMIILYYCPTAECVPLDTHVLKHLRVRGVPNVPKSTPSAGKNYERLEKEFVKMAKNQGFTVREYDTQVWQFYAKI